MSPAALRTYRAERLLERDFHSLRANVLGIVAARLRAAGGSLDRADLEECYAAAWQGLYGATVRGQTIANPAAWLALVTYRRAIEELRLARAGEAALDTDASVERDLDAELDARARLRQLLEGMRCRLDLREREAAALCYLHGYSRAEAARHMGISEVRMRKLMEGRGAGHEGVSQKVGALVQTICAGDFCHEQESLIRAHAFGMLDPDGERHRVALAHLRSCPACRRHVTALRGLAVTLPPVLTLPGAGKLGLAALAAGASHGGRAMAPVSGSAPLGASAAAGSGAAGGGWAIGGAGLAAKLAAGCVIALGVGAGCVALERGAWNHGGRRRTPAPRLAPVTPASADAGGRPAAPGMTPSAHPLAPAGARVPALARTASREFTPEQARSEPQPRALARTAGVPAPRAMAPAGAAEREFGPG